MTNEIDQEKGPAHTDNPYAPPKAEIPIPPSMSEADFYVVSFKKFLILSVATLGLYSIYWFWKHWTLYKYATGDNIWAIPRAIFSIFFTHSLFGKIEKEAESVAGNPMPSLTFPATLYVITELIYNISDRFMKETSVMLDVIVSIIFVSVITWCLWQAQKQANIACNDVEGESNSHFTGLNYLFIVLGLAMWGFAIFVAVAEIIQIYPFSNL